MTRKNFEKMIIQRYMGDMAIPNLIYLFSRRQRIKLEDERIEIYEQLIAEEQERMKK